MSRGEKFMLGIACFIFAVCSGCTDPIAPKSLPPDPADAHPWQVPIP